jgi:hypothetical protein
MRPARGLVRLVPPRAIALIAIVMCAALLGGRRAAQASAPSSQDSPGSEGSGAGAPSGSEGSGAKKKAHKPGAKSNGKSNDKSNDRKTSPKAKASPATKVTRRKSSTHLAPQKLAHAQSGKSGTRAGTRSDTINEDVTLTPFPSHAGAAKKALAQNRRDQLEDAEKAARAPEQAERWQTVLFHLRDLDARSDSEGCFWRLVSYYRLGQIERARSLRPACELAAKDTGIIEAEDEQAARLQAAGTTADKEPAPVGNLAPYAGDGPARVER